MDDRRPEDGGMRVVRVYTGADGESHFEDLRVPLADAGFGSRLSRLIRGSGVVFRQVGGDYDLDFHNAPRRQFVVNLVGAVDIGVGDGAVRRLGSGDILLAEDTHGRGHRSKAVDGAPRLCLFIPLDDDETLADF